MALGDRLREVVAVLGDPGAVSRVGRKGGTMVFNFRPAFSPDPFLPTLSFLLTALGLISEDGWLLVRDENQADSGSLLERSLLPKHFVRGSLDLISS